MSAELQAQFDALQMELRGYEVARMVVVPTDDGKTAIGWERVGAYRPNDRGRDEALRSMNHLNHLAKKAGRNVIHRMRPVVSIDIEAAMGSQQQEGPLHLDADLEDAVVVPEELLAMTPAANEGAYTLEEMADLVKQAQAMHDNPDTTDEDCEKLVAEFMRPPSARDFIPEISSSFASLANKLEGGE